MISFVGKKSYLLIMAQPYLIAMDHAEWHAQNIIRKHKKNRPLGRIEAQHRYHPPQPVLSCRTVNIDLSGTRTYRAKSAHDIIDEQQQLIHHVYSRARNVTSAPVTRKPPTGTWRPQNSDNHIDDLHFLNIRGAISRQDSFREVFRPSSTGSSRQSGVQSSLRPRPSTVQGIDRTKSPQCSSALRSSSDFYFEEDPSWENSARTNRQINKQIREQWSVENHSLDEGQFVRGKKDKQLASLDPKTGNEWVAFGGGQRGNSAGVVDAFTGSNAMSQDELFVVDGNTGSHVAKQIQKGDKIRIGNNGAVQSRNFHIKQWLNDQNGKQAKQPDGMGPSAPRVQVPLCWDDQLNQQPQCVRSPRSAQDAQAATSLCESHPVIIQHEESEASSEASFNKKYSQAGDGYKIKMRSRGHTPFTGQGVPRKVTSITIDKSDTSLDREIDKLTYEDILNMKVRSSKKVPDYKPTETFSTHSTEAPQHPDPETETRDVVKDDPDSAAHTPDHGVQHIPDLCTRSSSSIPYSRPSTSMSQVADQADLDALVVGNAPGSRPAGRNGRPTSSTRPEQASSQRITSAGRPPKPALSRTTSNTSNKTTGSRGDAKYIQISQPVHVPVRIQSHPWSPSVTAAPSPGPTTHIDIFTELNKANYKHTDGSEDIMPEDNASTEGLHFTGEECRDSLLDTPSNTPQPSPPQSPDLTYAFDIPTGQSLDTGDRRPEDNDS